MKRALAVLIAGLAAAMSASAYTSYYFSYASSFTFTSFSVNGTGTVITNSDLETGITASSSAVSAISTLAVPDGSSDYMVKLVVAHATGSDGLPAIFLRASSNSDYQQTSGTNYMLKFGVSSVSTYKRVSNVVTLLGTYSYPGSHQLTDGDRITGYAYGNKIGVTIDGIGSTTYTDSSIASGQPGFGIAASVGNAGWIIPMVELGPIDRIAPTAILPGSIKTSSFSNRVDMQWSGVVDDVNGIGIDQVAIYRNGVLLVSSFYFQTNTFSDNTVAPSTAYSYLLTAIDHHGNTASTAFSVTTPPPGSIDPRRVGVRQDGAYWGGKGEQIDLLSGNLNYSVPLLSAKSRGGQSIPIGLSYNSQNWRSDPAAEWKLGNDVGNGFGWRLQAGSLTDGGNGRDSFRVSPERWLINGKIL